MIQMGEGDDPFPSLKQKACITRSFPISFYRGRQFSRELLRIVRMTSKAYTDGFIGAGLIAIGAIIHYVLIPYHVDQTPHPGLSASFFPELITWFLIMIGAILIVQSLWMGRREKSTFQIQWDRRERNHGLMVIAISVLYVYLISTLGYFIATPVGFAGLMVMMGVRRWWTLVISICVFTLIIFLFVEKFLKISLPGGKLFS